ncbi:hypothetical protein Pan97_42800 [Bremerella volcania]|uniref:Uncharacterized protein n=1 Tax=Bremerella volcania TaxID=2527984 RepID=A0A518CDC8_9BACT|nr:hypothetical protein [Bremerella volcania]QDU77218.1 hypothetical protein Pan97_42800 [Bremerella volcania]
MNVTSQQIENETAGAKPARRRGLRFSIATMILVTAVVALVISHAMTSLQLMEMQEDLRRAHATAGMFHIQDPDHLYVRSISQPLLHVWQWRIQVPPGKSYRTDLSELVPRGGYPTEVWPLELQPGDNLLTIQLVRSELGTWKALRFLDWKQDDKQQAAHRRYDSRELKLDGGKWLEVGNQGLPPITNAQAAWLDNDAGKVIAYPHSVLPADLVIQGPGGKQHMELFRIIDLQVPTADNNGNEGLLIWIEELSPKNAYGNQ